VQASDGICGGAAAASIDGYPAYPYCGNFDVYSDNGIDTQSFAAPGWTQTEGGYGYQCAEFAVRYFLFKWGVSGWSFLYATDMCNGHPSGVSTTSSPVHGDLAVIWPGACGVDATAGHVFVIDSVSGGQIVGVQQNVAGKYTWGNLGCVQCYLHAASNTQDPCSTAPVPDGYWCGQSTQWGGGTPDVLYHCQNHVTVQMTPCQYGCAVEPVGTDDQCNPPPDPCSTAPVPDGYWCGQSTQWGGGTPNVLYQCQGGHTAAMTACQYGCIVEPVGQPDQCAPAPSSSSSSGSGSSSSSSGSGTGGGSGGSTAGDAGTEHDAGHTTSTGGASGTGGSASQGGGSPQHSSGCAVGGGEAPASGAILAMIGAGLGLRRRRAAARRRAA
jgi:hypothetical protein